MGKGKKRISYFYIIALFLVIPVYHRGSFDNITQNKVEAFYFISGITAVLFLAVSLYEDVYRKSGSMKWSFCLRDAALAGFLCTAVISAIISPFGSTALYGVPGFGMGLLSLSVMIISCFYLSAVDHYPAWLLHLIVAVSLFPTVLAILNRLGYDPLHMYPPGANMKGHLYVSTFGNYGWYSEYMSLICPVILCALLTNHSRRVRAFYMISLLLTIPALFLAGTTTLAVTLSAVTLIAVCRSRLPRLRERVDRKLPFLFGGGFLTYILFVAGSTAYDHAWSGRGYIWRLSASVFGSLSLKEKLIGVGPNCYMDALNRFLGTDDALAAEFQEGFGGLALTSSHSEPFDYLITLGIVGLMFYLLFLYAFFAALRGRELTLQQETATLCVISYLIYTTMNFSMVCATPFFFVFLGMAAVCVPPRMAEQEGRVVQSYGNRKQSYIRCKQ